MLVGIPKKRGKGGWIYQMFGRKRTPRPAFETMLRNLRPFFTLSMILFLRCRNTSCEMVGEETAVRAPSTPSGASFLRFLTWSSARERSDGVEVPWTPAVTKE